MYEMSSVRFPFPPLLTLRPGQLLVPLSLTLPLIAPPLPDVDGLRCAQGSWQVVVCPLAHHRYVDWTVEHDERKFRQVDTMNLHEDLLPLSRIRYFLLLSVEGIQCMVAVEVNIESIGRELIARQYPGIIGIIGRARGGFKLGDVISARHGSRGRGGLSLRQEGIKEHIVMIVLDVELDADLSQVVLNDRFAIHAPGLA